MSALIKYTAFVFAIAFQICNAWGVCEIQIPPFDKRVKDSNLVFTGIPISDKPMETPDETVNRVVKIEVKKKFKGITGKFVELFYKSVPANGRELCEPNDHPRFDYAAEEKIELLFYSQRIKGHQLVSSEMGGGPTKFLKVKKEIKQLSKMIF